jgi:anti-anti-sigma factor
LLKPTITATQLDGVSVVALHGEHDLSTADELRRVLADAAPRTVVDLTAATFIDSSTLNAILHGRENGAGPAIAVVAPVGGEPRRVLDLVHLGDIVRVFPIRELAIAALTQPRSDFLATPRHGRASAR